MKYILLTILFLSVLLLTIYLFNNNKRKSVGLTRYDKLAKNVCPSKKISALYTKGNKILRTDNNKEIVLRGVLSDYFRYGLAFNTDFTHEGIEGIKKRFNVFRKYGANIIGFYLSGTTQLKQNIKQLDTFVNYAMDNGIYVYFMPVSRDFEGIIYEMPQAQPYIVGNFLDLKELLHFLSMRYRNYPNILYGMGAEPELKYENFETWNKKQIELAKIIRQNSPNSILLVSSTSKTFNEFETSPFPFKNVIYFGGGYTSENDNGAKNHKDIVEKRINTIVHQLDTANYPILMGEFGGNYSGDFSSQTDIEITKKILKGINSRELSFTAYNLSVIGADDHLTLLDIDERLTTKGNLFVNSFRSNCNN